MSGSYEFDVRLAGARVPLGALNEASDHTLAFSMYGPVAGLESPALLR
jgi:hypothetical protein